MRVGSPSRPGNLLDLPWYGEFGEKGGDTGSTDGGKPKKRIGKEKSKYYEKQRKSEIETAEAETINGDAVGATGVVGERAGGFSGT